MGKIKEKKAVDSLIERLDRFLRAKGKERETLAKNIDEFASFDLMEYNEEFEEFSEELKDIMDSMFFLHKWKGEGVYYGRERFIGTDDIKELVKRLKELRKEL